MRYQNPIIKGFNPDPSICRVGDDYFLVTSTFEYLPGIPIYHSKDLINWKLINHCLTKDSQIDLKGVFSSGGIFAPTIRYHDGLFFVICTNMNPNSNRSGNFIVYSENPFKKWSDPIFIEEGGIDPSLYFENGRIYVQLTSSHNGKNAIKQFEINLQTGEMLSHPQVISYGTGGRDLEAPHMYNIDGKYYLLVAEGGTREVTW